MGSNSKRTRAELTMIVVAFIWGATFVVVKGALQDMGPFMFLGLRFLLAFAILAAMAWSNMLKIRRSTVWYGCLLGFFLFIGYSFQTVGLKYTTSSNAGFITGISVVLVPIIYALLNKNAPEWKTTLTVLVALSGLYLMSFQSDSFRLSYGDFLELICAFGFALHIVFVDRYSHRHNAVAITAIQILFVGLISMGIGIYVESWPGQITTTVASAILITSLFATSLAFLLLNAMQKYSTPTRFAVVLTTEPVFTALAAYFWAGETLTLRGQVGAAMILVSMLISIVTRKKEEPLVEPLG